MKKFLLVAAFALAAFGAAAQTLPNVAMVFEPFNQNGIYRVGERAGWTIHASLGMAYTKYNYEIRENNLKVLKAGVIDLSSGTGTIEATLDKPGMLYARLSFIGAPEPATAPTAQELNKMTVAAAIAPERIQSAIPKPADFDAFWAGKLAALKQVPLNPQVEAAATGPRRRRALHRQGRQPEFPDAGLSRQAEGTRQISGSGDLPVCRRLCPAKKPEHRPRRRGLAGAECLFARHAARPGHRAAQLCLHRQYRPRSFLLSEYVSARHPRARLYSRAARIGTAAPS